MNTNLQTNKPERLLSLDALRGFDMIWIAGGERIIEALAKYTNWPIFNWLRIQIDHVQWNGFHFYDLIFPLFLFLAGVSIPFSIMKRKERGDSMRSIYIHLIKRCIVLIVLGIIYNGALSFDWPIRFASVLARISLGWFFAALIVLHFKQRGQIIWIAGILLFYWAIMMLVPVPGIGAGVLTMDGNLSAYIDRLLLPGRLFDTIMDPEGILSTIPAVATALLGAMTGFFLKDESLKLAKYKKGITLFIGGVALVLIAVLWNEVFPINKKMWTSSFVFCAGGLSLIFLSIFYLIIDAFEYRKWAFPLVVIGMNSITIYLCQPAFSGFSAFKDFAFSGIIHLFSSPVQPIIDASAYLLTGWLVLYFLYRNKIFLKV
ncbi:MAG: DUF5009 domain-containing protein [Bacteroidales bacterium]|nr:DUF5009 domain-containing protein [Bacteroidales bacterium]